MTWLAYIVLGWLALSFATVGAFVCLRKTGFIRFAIRCEVPDLREPSEFDHGWGPRQ